MRLPCEQNNDVSLAEHDARIEQARLELEELELASLRGITPEDVLAERSPRIPTLEQIQAARDRYAAKRREMHPDFWFMDPGSGRETLDGQRRRRAIQACWFDCPMKARPVCLDVGLQPGPTLEHGIYGGRTEDERQQIVTMRDEHERGRPLQTR